MSLLICNGSPRGKNSNSSVIVKWFLEGYKTSDEKIVYLNKAKQHEAFASELLKYDDILMVFPLYVDGMPGQVKHFFECLNVYKNDLRNKNITFIIHSGFSESVQNRALEKYLIRLSDILGFKNNGVIIIPGSEGFRLMQPFMTNKKRMLLRSLAEEFKNKNNYNETILSKLRGQEKMSSFRIKVYNLLNIFGVINFYWNMRLKENNAYSRRFDAPYKG